VTACRAPRWEPRKDNPAGDCRQPAIAGVPLGETGRVLPVCGECADRYERIVDLPEEDP
jgi:hypothetical protein